VFRWMIVALARGQDSWEFAQALWDDSSLHGFGSRTENFALETIKGAHLVEKYIKCLLKWRVAWVVPGGKGSWTFRWIAPESHLPKESHGHCDKLVNLVYSWLPANAFPRHKKEDSISFQLQQVPSSHCGQAELNWPVSFPLQQLPLSAEQPFCVLSRGLSKLSIDFTQAA
jgi:hypothetical protein